MYCVTDIPNTTWIVESIIIERHHAENFKTLGVFFFYYQGIEHWQ